MDPAFLAGLEVLDVKFRAGLFAADKGEPLAIGRWLGPHRAAGAGHDRLHLPRLEIIALDREQLVVRILRIFEDRAGRGVAREIDMLATGRIDRFAQFLLMLLIGLLDQRHAATARDVIDPDLTRAERTAGGEMLARDDEAAIGAPSRLGKETEILPGHLSLVGAIEVHHPDILAAAAIGGEGDAPAIGRETRLHVEREPLGNAPGRAARNIHGVDITQQIEGDRPAIGADIDIHPGAFGHVDRDLTDGRALGRVDIPLLSRPTLVVGSQSRGRQRKRQHGRQLKTHLLPPTGSGDFARIWRKAPFKPANSQGKAGDASLVCTNVKMPCCDSSATQLW